MSPAFRMRVDWTVEGRQNRTLHSTHTTAQKFQITIFKEKNLIYLKINVLNHSNLAVLCKFQVEILDILSRSVQNNEQEL